jgi:hypothetical protein
MMIPRERKDALNAAFAARDEFRKKRKEKESETGVCCLCGGPYEHFGNNAFPLGSGRCCDMCNEVVILVRLFPLHIKDQIDRIAIALRHAKENKTNPATAALCATLGSWLRQGLVYPI